MAHGLSQRQGLPHLLRFGAAAVVEQAAAHAIVIHLQLRPIAAAAADRAVGMPL